MVAYIVVRSSEDGDKAEVHIVDRDEMVRVMSPTLYAVMSSTATYLIMGTPATTVLAMSTAVYSFRDRDTSVSVLVPLTLYAIALRGMRDAVSAVVEIPSDDGHGSVTSDDVAEVVLRYFSGNVPEPVRRAISVGRFEKRFAAVIRAIPVSEVAQLNNFVNDMVDKYIVDAIVRGKRYVVDRRSVLGFLTVEPDKLMGRVPVLSVRVCAEDVARSVAATWLPFVNIVAVVDARGCAEEPAKETDTFIV